MKKMIGFLLVLALFLSFIPQGVFAEGSGLSFSVQPVLDSDQKQGIKNYFYIQTKDPSERTFSLRITNNADRPMVVEITPTNALTSPNGGIEYTPETTKENARLLSEQNAMAARIIIDPTVSLAAKESKIISFQVNLPELSNATVLGGLAFSEQKEDEIEETDTDSNISFKIKSNRLIIAFAADMGTPPPPQFSFGDATPLLLPAAPHVFVGMKNDSSAILKSASGQYGVYTEEGELLFEGQFKNIDMAPMTETKHPIFWNYDVYEEGNYVLKATATVGEEVIEKDIPFTVKKENMVVYTPEEQKNPEIKHSTDDESSKTPLWVWLVIGFFALFSFFLLFLLLRKRKDEQKPE